MAKDHDKLMEQMAREKAKWDEEEDQDETDNALSNAIELAIEQGKGWKDGEKEEYMARICDDDNLPALFATTQEDLEKSGVADAFASLVYEGESPTSLMIQFKKKGNDKFLNGKKSAVKNVQYYRDAINHYYEAFAWAEKIESFDSPEQFPPEEEKKTDDPYYTHDQVDELKSTICANAAMAHMMLKNWGYVRNDSKKAILYNKDNVKAWYRLAKAYEGLRNWEEVGDAIESGLAIVGESGNKDLKKLQKNLNSKVRIARAARQKRERARAERVANVKKVWKWCKENQIQLGRVPLVASVTDDEETGDIDEFRWHHHHPHTGKLPQQVNDNDFAWPCMFVYPVHGQSDFVQHFGEFEMIAERMAEIFPELEDGELETAMPWDHNNEYVCSNLVAYFEVQCEEVEADGTVHPEYVEPLTNQAETMRFYEASRALKGDEGPDMANVARAVERRRLHRQRKAWKEKHGSLWSKPGPCPVVQVHPAVTLKEVLRHKDMVVPNFLPTFLLFPINHEAHKKFLKEHKCIDLIEPKL